VRARSAFWLAVPALVVSGCVAASPAPSGSTPSGAASGNPASPAASAANATVTVELRSNGPVLDGPHVDASYLLPAALTWDDGTYHLWGVAFEEEVAAPPRPVYASSSDGMVWAIGDGDPMVGISAGLETSPPGPLPGSVIREADGSWVMYLTAILAPATRGPDLYRATAPAPEGPWTVDPEPTLSRDADGWDGAGLDFPSVAHTDDGWFMTYSGSSLAEPNQGAVGIATSPDGITWTKEPEPVIRPGLCGEFDDRTINLPRLRRTDDGWLLFYLGQEWVDLTSVGVAASSDGLSWGCGSPEPVLAGVDIPDSLGIHTIAVATDAPGPELLIESLQTSTSELWLGELVESE
jgi:hypothetical protein